MLIRKVPRLLIISIRKTGEYGVIFFLNFSNSSLC